MSTFQHRRRQRPGTQAAPGPSPRARREARKRAAAVPEQTRDLLDVLDRGAVVRRHRFLADFSALCLPAIISAVLQIAIYAAVIVGDGRSDWDNLAIVSVVLALMPFAVITILSSLRSRDFPFTFSALVTLIVHNFGIVLLSGLRIPISYLGLFATLPVAVVLMVIAATRLNRAQHEKMAILDFPRAREIARILEGDITIIDKSDANLAGFDRILIDGATHHTPAWNGQLTRAYMHGALVTPWFTVIEQKRGQLVPEFFDITHLAYTPSQVNYTRIKRALDIFFVLLSLPVVLPLGGLVWLYIRLVDGGPSVFVQTRRGYAGRSFRMLKFRTMRKGTQGASTAENDTRILPGCAILRRLRIDELPQMINIWRGEMSWIGPRPLSLKMAKECERLSPVYLNRYLVPPGITGWAQVHYGYADTAREEVEKLGYDLYYVKNISFDLDLEIVMRTIRTLLTRQGAR